MQKEKLVVKNFFSLKNIDIELSKFNVFIGEQASGKSLIIKLIYFFRYALSSLPELSEIEFVDSNTKQADIFKNIFNLNSSTLNCRISYYINEEAIEIIAKNNKIVIKYSENLMKIFRELNKMNQQAGELHRDLLYHNLQKEQYDKLYKNILPIVDKIPKNDVKKLHEPNENYHSDISELMNLYSSSYAERLDKIKKQYDSFCKDNKLSPTRSLKFLPAGRMSLMSLLKNLFNLIGSTPNLSTLIVKFGQDFQKAESEFDVLPDQDNTLLPVFEEYMRKILKGKYVHNPLNPYIQHDKFQTLISNSSSGQQEVYPIYIILRHYLLSGHKNGRLFIEEPEAHLYPTAQKHIVELLTYITNVTDSSGLYITTHSPYILTVLNNLITANEVKTKQKTPPNISPDILINFDEVRAYFINGDGTATSLMDKEYRLINAEILDEVSNTISEEYSEMIDLL